VSNWLQLLSGSEPGKLKEQVSLAAVVVHHNVELRADGERLVGLCPFHDDHDASFAVWELDDGTELCGCWSCDFRPGDVFDFVQRFNGIKFPQAVQVVSDYVRDGLPDAPRIPVRDPNAPLPDLSGIVNNARTRDLGPLHLLLVSKGIAAPAEWLAAEFRLGVGEQGEITIPHYSRDDELRASKWRTAETKPIAVSGSRLDSLYGAWRDRGQPRVVLCEGESDTWDLAYAARHEDILVLGLPSGVAARPKDEWLEQLSDREVVIMFDADDAGRRGCAAWTAALQSRADVFLGSLPEGEDVVSAGAQTVLTAVAEAWAFIDPAGLPITVGGTRYVRVNPQNGTSTVLSDFVFHVERLVMGEEDGIVLEVRVPTKRDTQVITAAELANPQRMRDWCAKRMLSWKGGSRDVADLLELLKADLLFAPRVRGTTCLGLHEQTFVLPNDTIGSAAWGYVPPTADVDLESVLRLDDRPTWDTGLPLALTRLHAPDVITPILGWVAAAPLRSLCSQFPILAVVGGAGWGKTTVIGVVLEAFGFWCAAPMTLTATTPYAVHAFSSSTNAFPIWFDEYRHGARADAKLALDQVLRDAWDGSAAVRGGQGEDKSAVKKVYARAPLLVTGEDAFDETSHAERMVILPMPRDGRDPQALRAVRDLTTTGFGRSYLEWLVATMNQDLLPAPPLEETRMEQARAVTVWGWSLLRQFCREEIGYDLPDIDMSRARAAHERLSDKPLYIRVLEQAIGRRDSGGYEIAWVEGADICVRVGDLVQWAKRDSDLVLPGKSGATEQWYKERFRTTDERGMYPFIRLHGAATELGLAG
jgi:hypothetical protein